MEINIRQWIVSVMILGALLVGGCTQQDVTSEASNLPTEPPATVQAPADALSNLPRLEGKATVQMVINGKPVTIEVDGTNAPITAGNFVDLIQRGVYDGLAFHRVVREPEPFVVQGGDPQSKDPNFSGMLGTGGFMEPETGRERSIPLEITPQGAQSPVYGQTFPSARISQPPALQHKRGAVAMARSQAPDSASSQFYFALSDLEFLDGNYAVFGTVTEGMDTVDSIQEGDRIQSARVVDGVQNLRVNGQ